MNDSSKDHSKEDVKAAREAKKLAKQKAKNKGESGSNKEPTPTTNPEQKREIVKVAKQNSKDEVDRATVTVKTVELSQEKDKDHIKAERAAKNTLKQTKKTASGDVSNAEQAQLTAAVPDMTVRDVIQTLRDIKNVVQQVDNITNKVQALDLDRKLSTEKTKEVPKPNSEDGKSKAELRAERRAKQEAQRAAKEAAAKEKTAKPKEQRTEAGKDTGKTIAVKEKSPKTTTKQGTKQQGHKVNWSRRLYSDDVGSKLNNIPINSSLHPAIIKLGVQLATRVVTGSNARCIALLDALKKMVRDYSLPAKTEFGRGLDSYLATSVQFLWQMRAPTASQTNAVKFFRHHLTQLPNNVDEFDAKKTLQEEIDRYIREQIDMAGEAISITVRKKISDGDYILTYGCSSLIERILVEAHEAGVKFHAVVCGGGGTARGAREMTRRLAARGLVCSGVDITALGFVMKIVDKVVLGASSLLANGSVLAGAGTAAVALAARASNRPVLVACETHKFTDSVHTDALVNNEYGDPDDLIDKSDENSPLKDWRSNPNLTPLNLSYDVTPPSLVTAVVTELAILPCTSAPVVLRFKLSEYSI